MSFAALPRELQLRIISSTLGSHPIDLAHAKALAIVSRDCYALVSGALWRHVRILRPSALRKFHAAIKANPNLAGLVRSIHVGPEDQLHCQGWPVCASGFTADRQHLDVPMLFLLTTLAEEELPRWVKPGSAFNIGHPEQDCKSIAVDLAIGEALAAIDVEPWRRGYSRSGRKVGFREWAQRLWLVQAALDLYLMEMARVETTQQCQIDPLIRPGRPPRRLASMAQLCALGRCGHYPRLEIRPHSYPGHQPAAAEDVRFYVSRSEIWQHIARSDGPANHFDHLMLLTESSRQPLAMTEVEWSRVRSALGGPHVQWLSNEAFKRMAAGEGVIQASDDHSEESSNDYGAPNGSDSNKEDFAPAAARNLLQGKMQKAEDLLLLAREVLASTTRITNLSLSGFLHRALDSLREPQRLLSLNLGPGLRWWDHVLPLSKGVFDGGIELRELHRLHICGTMSTQDAGKIGGGKMKLDTVVWEMTEQGVAAEHILRVLHGLQGQASPSNSQQSEGQTRTTHVRLRAKVGKTVVSEAPSPEIARAWALGQSVEGTVYPVTVMRSPNDVVTLVENTLADEQRVLAAQHAEKREWWEQACEGAGVGAGE